LGGGDCRKCPRLRCCIGRIRWVSCTPLIVIARRSGTPHRMSERTPLLLRSCRSTPGCLACRQARYHAFRNSLMRLPRRGPLSRVEDLRDDSAELVLESPDALPLLGEHPDRVRAQGMPSAPRVSTDSRPCYDRPRGGSVGPNGSPAGSRRRGFVLGARRAVTE